MKNVMDYTGIKEEQMISEGTDSDKQNGEARKSAEKVKIKENLKSILDNPWFGIATTAIIFAAPIVSGPMMASAGKVAPKLGKALKYSPRVINGITIIKDRIL